MRRDAVVLRDEMQEMRRARGRVHELHLVECAWKLHEVHVLQLVAQHLLLFRRERVQIPLNGQRSEIQELSESKRRLLIVAGEVLWRGRIERMTWAFSSRISLAWKDTGGSMATSASTSRRWFWITSRMAPVSS